MCEKKPSILQNYSYNLTEKKGKKIELKKKKFEKSQKETSRAMEKPFHVTCEKSFPYYKIYS